MIAISYLFRIKVDIPAKGDEIPQSTTQNPKNDKQEEAAGLGAGVYVIIILVILIVLACIGYCVYQKFYHKKDPQNADENDKKQYNQEAQSEPNPPNSNTNVV